MAEETIVDKTINNTRDIVNERLPSGIHQAFGPLPAAPSPTAVPEPTKPVKSRRKKIKDKNGIYDLEQEMAAIDPMWNSRSVPKVTYDPLHPSWYMTERFKTAGHPFRSAIEVSESFKTNLFKILDPTEDNTFANMINGVGFRDIYDSVVGKDWRPGKKLGIVSGLEKTAQEVADTLGPLASLWYPGEKEVQVGEDPNTGQPIMETQRQWGKGGFEFASKAKQDFSDGFRWRVLNSVFAEPVKIAWGHLPENSHLKRLLNPIAEGAASIERPENRFGFMGELGTLILGARIGGPGAAFTGGLTKRAILDRALKAPSKEQLNRTLALTSRIPKKPINKLYEGLQWGLMTMEEAQDFGTIISVLAAGGSVTLAQLMQAGMLTRFKFDKGLITKGTRGAHLMGAHVDASLANLSNDLADLSRKVAEPPSIDEAGRAKQAEDIKYLTDKIDNSMALLEREADFWSFIPKDRPGIERIAKLREALDFQLGPLDKYGVHRDFSKAIGMGFTDRTGRAANPLLKSLLTAWRTAGDVGAAAKDVWPLTHITKQTLDLPPFGESQAGKALAVYQGKVDKHTIMGSSPGQHRATYKHLIPEQQITAGMPESQLEKTGFDNLEDEINAGFRNLEEIRAGVYLEEAPPIDPSVPSSMTPRAGRKTRTASDLEQIEIAHLRRVWDGASPEEKAALDIKMQIRMQELRNIVTEGADLRAAEAFPATTAVPGPRIPTNKDRALFPLLVSEGKLGNASDHFINTIRTYKGKTIIELTPKDRIARDANLRWEAIDNPIDRATSKDLDSWVDQIQGNQDYVEDVRKVFSDLYGDTGEVFYVYQRSKGIGKYRVVELFWDGTSEVTPYRISSEDVVAIGKINNNEIIVPKGALGNRVDNLADAGVLYRGIPDPAGLGYPNIFALTFDDIRKDLIKAKGMRTRQGNYFRNNDPRKNELLRQQADQRVKELEAMREELIEDRLRQLDEAYGTNDLSRYNDLSEQSTGYIDIMFGGTDPSRLTGIVYPNRTGARGWEFISDAQVEEVLHSLQRDDPSITGGTDDWWDSFDPVELEEIKFEGGQRGRAASQHRTSVDNQLNELMQKVEKLDDPNHAIYTFKQGNIKSSIAGEGIAAFPNGLINEAFPTGSIPRYVTNHRGPLRGNPGYTPLPGKMKNVQVFTDEIIDYHGRAIVLVLMPDGKYQPFYRRTGRGGPRGGPQPGDWAPFDGIANKIYPSTPDRPEVPQGWMNKLTYTHEGVPTKSVGWGRNPTIKRIAQALKKMEKDGSFGNIDYQDVEIGVLTQARKIDGEERVNEWLGVPNDFNQQGPGIGKGKIIVQEERIRSPEGGIQGVPLSKEKDGTRGQYINDYVLQEKIGDEVVWLNWHSLYATKDEDYRYLVDTSLLDHEKVIWTGTKGRDVGEGSFIHIGNIPPEAIVYGPGQRIPEELLETPSGKVLPQLKASLFNEKTPITQRTPMTGKNLDTEYNRRLEQTENQVDTERIFELENQIADFQKEKQKLDNLIYGSNEYLGDLDPDGRYNPENYNFNTNPPQTGQRYRGAFYHGMGRDRWDLAPDGTPIYNPDMPYQGPIIDKGELPGTYITPNAVEAARYGDVHTVFIELENPLVIETSREWVQFIDFLRRIPGNQNRWMIESMGRRMDMYFPQSRDDTRLLYDWLTTHTLGDLPAGLQKGAPNLEDPIDGFIVRLPRREPTDLERSLSPGIDSNPPIEEYAKDLADLWDEDQIFIPRNINDPAEWFRDGITRQRIRLADGARLEDLRQQSSILDIDLQRKVREFDALNGQYNQIANRQGQLSIEELNDLRARRVDGQNFYNEELSERNRIKSDLISEDIETDRQFIDARNQLDADVRLWDILHNVDEPPQVKILAEVLDEVYLDPPLPPTLRKTPLNREKYYAGMRDKFFGFFEPDPVTGKRPTIAELSTKLSEAFTNERAWVGTFTERFRKAYYRKTGLALLDEDNPALLMQLSDGAYEAGVSKISPHIRDIKKFLKDNDLFAEDGIDFDALVTLYRAIEVAESTGRPGPLLKGIDTIQEAYDEIIKISTMYGPEKMRMFKHALDNIGQAHDDLIEYLVNNGIVPKDLAIRLKTEFPHYSPTYYLEDIARLSESPAQNTGQQMRDFTTRREFLKHLGDFGSDAAKERPLEALERSAGRAEQLVQYNNARKAYINSIIATDPAAMKRLKRNAKNPHKPSRDASPGKQLIATLEDGEWVWYETDPYIVNSMKQRFLLPIAIRNGLSRVQDPIRFFLTGGNPLFWGVQIVHDSLMAWVFAGIGPHRVAAALAKNLLAIVRWDQEFEDLVREGIMLSQGFTKQPGARRLLKQPGFQRSTDDIVLNTVRKGKRFFRNLPRGIETFGSAFEYAGRRAVAEGMIRSKKVTYKQAVKASRDIFGDWAIKGSQFNWLNSFYLYANIAVQGPLILSRNLHRPGAAKRLMGLIAGMSALQMWNSQFSSYINLTSREKYTQVSFIYDEYEDEFGVMRAKRIVLVPYTRELAWLTGPAMFLLGKLQGTDPAGFKELTKTLAQSGTPFSPMIDFGHGIPLPVMPTEIGNTLSELARNYDGFRGQPIIPLELQGKPSHEQKTAQTSETAKLISKALGGIISPLEVDFITNKGSILTSLIHGADKFIRLSGEDAELRRMAEGYRSIRDTAPDSMRRKLTLQWINNPSNVPPTMRRQVRAEVNQLDREEDITGIPVVDPFIKRFYRTRGSYGSYPISLVESIAKANKSLDSDFRISQEDTQAMNSVLSSYNSEVKQSRAEWGRRLDRVGPEGISGAEYAQHIRMEAAGHRLAEIPLSIVFPRAARVLLEGSEYQKFLKDVRTVVGYIDDPMTKGQFLLSARSSIVPSMNPDGNTLSPTNEAMIEFYDQLDAFDEQHADDLHLMLAERELYADPVYKQYLLDHSLLEPYFRRGKKFVYKDAGLTLEQTQRGIRDLKRDIENANRGSNRSQEEIDLIKQSPLLKAYNQFMNKRGIEMRYENDWLDAHLRYYGYTQRFVRGTGSNAEMLWQTKQMPR